MVADVSDPQEPDELGSLFTGAFAHSVTVDGAMAHVGLVIDEHKTDFERGDFLIRGVLGVNQESGSTKSFEDAVHQGIERANQSLRNLRSTWIKEQRVWISDGEPSEYQVNMVVTFVLED